MREELSIPVLFLVFNRLDTMQKVFEQIRIAKPPKIYIASDGARRDRQHEYDVVKSVRQYILNNIDWTCEVKTLFRDENIGCGAAVSSAISWFFEHEEMGIILEDDVVPVQSFFGFCQKMLKQYKNDERVMMITGTNFMVDIRDDIKQDYFFSRHFAIWGWATWRRAWELYDVNISCWRNSISIKDIEFVSREKHIISHFNNMFDLVYYKKIDTWDFQWVFTCLFNYGLCLTPSINMISNIGIQGTHMNGDITDNHFLKTLDFKNIDNIKINKLVYPENIYENILYKKVLYAYKKDHIICILKKIGLYSIARIIYKNLYKKWKVRCAS